MKNHGNRDEGVEIKDDGGPLLTGAAVSDKLSGVGVKQPVLAMQSEDRMGQSLPCKNCANYQVLSDFIGL